MKKLKFFWIIFFIFNLLLPLTGSAWDKTGHQLIAEIAYEHLTPVARQQVNQLIHQFEQFYPENDSFISAAPWMDYLRGDNVNAFNDWHFINLPFSTDNSPLPPVEKENIIWAIQQSQQVLESKNSNQFEKALFLLFLIHLTGDAHQPLHCATRVTKQYPYGDNGGGLYPIIGLYADNLHEYWDQGAGFFSKYFKNYPLHNRQIRQLAHKIEATYPESYFESKINDLNPADWAQESFIIAKDFAYQVPEQANLVTEYIGYTTKAQQIASKQIALAGYRLAYMLNAIFAKE